MSKMINLTYIPPFADMPGEDLAKGFKKACLKSGLLKETKRRRFFEKPSVAKRRKHLAFLKAQRKRQRRAEVLTGLP